MLREYLSRTRFRRQLTAIVGMAMLGLALVSSLLNSWEARRRMQDYLVGQGLQISESLARQSTLALLYGSADNAWNEVAATLAFPDVLHVEITDASGRVLLAQGKKDVLNHPHQGRPHTFAPTGAGPDAATEANAVLEHETDREWRFVAPVYTGREELSPFELHERQPQLLGYVRVVVGKASMDRLVTSLLFVNLGLSLSFAIVLLAVMGFLVERLIRPLNSLSHLMRRAEAGESGLRATASGPRDITDMASAFNKMMAVLEEREAELQQSRDRAVHTAKMKTQFAATVSHEVRTPLNGVVGMLDMLREMRLTRPQRECVEVAWNSSQALMELINGILDFSKLEAGKLRLEEIDFDLRELLEEATGLLAKQAQQKGLELGYVLAGSVPARVRGDSLRLRQVLINLMSNAVKFTERGEVAVRASSIFKASNLIELHVEVSDTGIGMHENTVQHVFESFAQADPSTTRKYGGTGLGLTISKHLLDLMGGEIGVRSTPGEGSTFWFTVPCKFAEAAEAPPVEPALQGRSVLVLEESSIVRDFLEESLAHVGMNCCAVSSTAEAITELRRAQESLAPYALVILDVDRVRRRNPDIVRRLREESGSMAPLLLLGRYGSEEKNADGDAFLAKPLRLATLLATVRQLLVGHRQSSVPVVIEAPAPAGEKKHYVLVVEDNPTNQMVAGAMLAKSGCHCEFAGNGREAVEVVRQKRFDLILMDCNMPEMDGYEATAHIRELEKSLDYRTPIVAMTANAQSGDEAICLAAGMDDYLAKPITLTKLRNKLEAWLAPLDDNAEAVPLDK